MARKKSAKVSANAETAVLDYRHDEAKRKNIPPAVSPPMKYGPTQHR